MSRKILIITYYWPPSGGSGVQRWLKFVKYLKRNGWEPIVYTVENGEYPVLDHSLEKEIPEGVTVIKKKIWEPYSAYKFLTGKKKNESVNITGVQQKEKESIGGKISKWIRANWMIPDPRVFWVKPSVQFLTQWLKENPVDAIITSGPPHSLHLIGMKLKEKTGIKWIADFRDPWRTNYFLLQLGMNKRTWAKQKELERQVLDAADKIIVVTPTMKTEMDELAGKETVLITNGYDEEDFISSEKVRRDTKFSLVFTGTFVNSQNPEILWKYLAEKIKSDPAFADQLEIKLVGQTGDEIKRSLELNGLISRTSFLSYLPHLEIVKMQKAAQVLLLSVNNTPTAKLILTGKLFEYLASGRPVLCFCPEDGDAGEIIKECNAGYVLNYNDAEKVKKAVDELFEKFKGNNLRDRESGFERYSRSELTKKLMHILENS